MSNTQITVDFHGTLIPVVEHNNEPYVSAKNISEGMGLDWKSQYSKLNHNRERWSMVKITMVANDERKRKIIALPLRKLPGWLMTIQPNKLSNELRPKIIQYQTECDEVLWQYWNKKNQAAQKPTEPTPLALPSQRTVLVTIIDQGKEPVTQTFQGNVSIIPNEAIIAASDTITRQTRNHTEIIQNAINALLQAGTPIHFDQSPEATAKRSGERARKKLEAL